MDSFSFIISLNTGFSIVTWLTYISLTLVILINEKYNNFYKTFLDRVFSNLLTFSILSVFMINTALYEIYKLKIFELLGNITLSFFLFTPTLVINTLWSKSSYLEKTMSVIYIITSVIVIFMLLISYLLNLDSLKLLVVLISVTTLVSQSFIFGTIHYKYIDSRNKIFGLLTTLLPSLLPTSILSSFFTHKLIPLFIFLFILLFNITNFFEMLSNMIQTYKLYTKLMEDFSKSIKNEEKIFKWFVVMLISLLEARDPYTRGHSERVARYSYNLAKLVYNNTYMPNFIEMGGLLHDIGKIGVRDEVLFFPSSLNKEMKKEMEKHPTIGKELLSSISVFEDVSNISYLHHEKLDGSGYPLKLKATDIPMYVRIVSIIDAFDAMNSARVYRKTLDFSQIKKEIISNSGTQFDKTLANILISNINKIT